MKNIGTLCSCHKKYYYRPQRSCGQGNIFTPVRHSVHRGGGLPQRPPPAKETPPETGTPTRHTVNERPVRISLECILVVYFGGQ